MEVQAAVCYEAFAPFQIQTLTLDGLGPDDVLVKIVGSGLCHTDTAARDGAVPVPKPCVLGHEGSGIVQAVGDNVSKVQPGDHVVLTYAFCGQCRYCDSGHPAYCERFIPLNFTDARSGESGTFYDGDEEVHGHFFGQSSFADFAVSHQHNVIKVRKDAPLELLGVLGCGVQTGAGYSDERTQGPTRRINRGLWCRPCRLERHPRCEGLRMHHDHCGGCS